MANVFSSSVKNFAVTADPAIKYHMHEPYTIETRPRQSAMIFQLGIDVGRFCSPATHPYAIIAPIIVASPLQLARASISSSNSNS